MIKPAYCVLLLGCGVLVLAALAGATVPASRASIVPARLQATSAAIYEIRADGSGQRRVGGEGAISFALSKDGRSSRSSAASRKPRLGASGS